MRRGPSSTRSGRARTVRSWRSTTPSAPSPGATPARALALLEAALARCRAAGDRAGIVNRLRDLGVVALGLGEYGRARRFLAESIAQGHAWGVVHGVGHARARLGVIARLEGDLPQARALFEASLAEQGAEGFRPGMNTALAGLGAVARAAGDVALARRHYGEILRFGRENGYDQYCQLGLGCLALLAAQEGTTRGLPGCSAPSLRRLGRCSGCTGRTWKPKRSRWRNGRAPRWGRGPSSARGSRAESMGVPQAVADALDEAPAAMP